MTNTCYISTGKKAVMHTLIDESKGDYPYIKNLSRDRKKAIEEAKKYAKENDLTYLGLYHSPLHKRAEHRDFYGIDFKHKRDRKKNEFYYGKVTQEFWKAWKKNKEQMKKDGFSVSKYEYRERSGNHDLRVDWYVFFKPKKED